MSENQLNILPISCPACSEPNTLNLGRLKTERGVINLPEPSDLYQCFTCGLLFRHPYIAISDLIRAYKVMPVDKWTHQDRPDFDLVTNVIYKFLSSGSILDVGCFRGDFLTRLPDTYLKYGIEPSESARKIAQKRGIKLVGTSIEHIEINRPMFHVITLIDVIEHLPYPMISLQNIAKLLLPSGIIIITTGNTDALPWLLMRRNYWYYFSEHVSFTNPRWFRWAAKNLGFDVVSVEKFSYFRGSIAKRWRQFLKCLLFQSLKHVTRTNLRKVICSIYPFNRVNNWPSAPVTYLWPDHMLIVMKPLTNKTKHIKFR